MTEVVIAGFGDERSYHAEEHAEYMGRRRLQISARLLSFCTEAKSDTLDKLSQDEFKNTTRRLQKQGKIRHITQATPRQLSRYKRLLQEHHVHVWDIGSALGKQYLGNKADVEALPQILKNTVRVTHELGTQRVRIFNFYPGNKCEKVPEGSPKYREYWQQAVAGSKLISEVFKYEGLVGYLEVEANLFGHNGESLMKFYDAIGAPANIVFYFDGANMVVQENAEVKDLSYPTYEAMIPRLGGLHIKDAVHVDSIPGVAVDEDHKWPFVQVGCGDSRYEDIFRDLIAEKRIREIEQRLDVAGLPRAVGVVLEPHLRMGGQFGGYTGSMYDVALKKLVGLLDKAGIGHQPINFN
ncbi:MAG: TIM barrel protein [Candidatus Woesearchaeota archaeon]